MSIQLFPSAAMAKKPKMKKTASVPTSSAPKITLKGIQKVTIDETANIIAEEHFLLRMPKNSGATAKLRDYVKKREVPAEIEFQDERHATFKLDGDVLEAVLVDLPCIIESQKTLDNKQFYKIADICQMLVVKEQGESLPLPRKKDEEFHFPHGLSAPLKHVRKRRFRKRISKKGIEDVEREVDRLLLADSQAFDVQYELYDQKEYEESYLRGEEEEAEEEQFETASAAGQKETEDFDDEFDLDLAAEIEEALNDELMEERGEVLSESSEEEEELNVEENESEEDEAAEKNPNEQQIAQLDEEIKDLTAKIGEKKEQAAKQMNIIMRKRIEDIIKSLNNELLIKKKQLAELGE